MNAKRPSTQWPRQLLVDFPSAMAHNRIPFVGDVELEGVDPSIGIVEIQLAVVERDETLTKPYSALVDIDGFGVGHLPAQQVQLDPSAMHRVEERRPAELAITARSGDSILSALRLDVEILAMRHWLVDLSRPNSSYELLPTHAMPNDPAVGLLLGEVRDRLQATIGSSSTQGYQASAERVDAIVKAIWGVARERNITYSNPPASWGDVGQEVRTPSEVLEGRTGTCLDTTVALASALEHVGINSIIWIVQGHAFLGYWRRDSEDGGILPSTAATDVSLVKNRVDTGAIRAMDTTPPWRSRGARRSAVAAVPSTRRARDGRQHPDRRARTAGAPCAPDRWCIRPDAPQSDAHRRDHPMCPVGPERREGVRLAGGHGSRHLDGVPHG